MRVGWLFGVAMLMVLVMGVCALECTDPGDNNHTPKQLIKSALMMSMGVREVHYKIPLEYYKKSEIYNIAGCTKPDKNRLGDQFIHCYLRFSKVQRAKFFRYITKNMGGYWPERYFGLEEAVEGFYPLMEAAMNPAVSSVDLGIMLDQAICMRDILQELSLVYPKSVLNEMVLPSK